MPTDVVESRLMVEFHFYDPYNFCLMENDADWGKIFWYWGKDNIVAGSEHSATWGEEEYVKEQFAKIKTYFVDKGYLKEALVNYVALLGWNPGDDREIFSLSELCEAFDVSGMSKSPAIFDPEKLTWMNAQYIMALSKEDFTRHAMPWYEKAGIARMDTDILCRILQQRVRVFNEIPDMVDFLTKLDEDYDAALFTNKKSKTDSVVSKEVLEMVIPALEALPNWNEELLHDTLIGMAAEKGMKNGTLLWPVRIAMAGKAVTPGGAIEIGVLLGKDETMRRLKIGLEKLQ